MAYWPIVPSIGLGSGMSIGQEENTGMAYWPIELPLKPVRSSIERLACFAEKAGLLAAAVIRQHPAEAHNL
ncbi:MAG TPA: hypothetical protein VGT82_13140, partial [Ktedonobacteraceae bacterium]|nr:hypothetical protein [Ktedonobacteraceae bacterium]